MKVCARLSRGWTCVIANLNILNCRMQVIRGLLNIYQCDPGTWAAVLIGGSGTSALEAMMASLLPPDAHVLVLENGVYGERLSRIADIHGIRSQALKAAWGDPIDLQAMADLLATGDFSHVLAVHHETTTGRLNPVDEIAALVHAVQGTVIAGCGLQFWCGVHSVQQ